MTDSETLKEEQAKPTVSSWVAQVWHLWRSDNGAGAHYATRRGRLTNAELFAGLERTLAADSPEELARLLADQPDAPRDVTS